MQLPIFLLLILFMTSAVSQSIIDYSYAESEERTRIEEWKMFDLSIFPSAYNNTYLEFPTSCSINKELRDQSNDQKTELEAVNIDQYLKKIKGEMTRFLALTQRIRATKQTLLQLQASAPIFNEENPLDESKMVELVELENNLKQINASIEGKVKQLNELISQEINRTKQNSFDEINLKFELNAYESRLKYLENLLNDQKDSSKDSPNYEKIIDDFFKEVDNQLKNEDKELTNLNELLKSYASNSELKLKASKIQNQIEALDIMIDEKDQCLKNRDKYTSQNNRDEIEEIIKKLKALKATESPNRNYCEGVAQKLLKQLKKVLRTYNYSFACAEGLEGLRINKTLLQINLKKVQLDIDRLQYDPRSNRIERYFNDSKNSKEERIRELKIFQIDHYRFNRSILELEIENTRQKLKDIKYRLEHPPEGEEKPMDFEKIREKMLQINQEQFEYCTLKEVYEDKYRKINIWLIKYEEKTLINIEHHKEVVKRSNELRQMEREFHELRAALLEELS